MSAIPTAVLTTASDRALRAEAATRRTFAIISHPDAGKTTLTEKFLLFAGAVQEAGAVKSRKQARTTTSDWMELEKQRGISISSTALHFSYGGWRFNLLDTPGHADFSEDTYRTLTAVDSAVMVIDAAKGIEPQTRKLFEVCRLRDVPIVTFINKLDREGRDPFELLDEIETRLDLQPVPPEQRDGTDEVALAREGRLARCASVGDLRGDLHDHTDWSGDGRMTLRQVLDAAGLPPAAISDVICVGGSTRIPIVRERLAETG